jgi:hypothetical protein
VAHGDYSNTANCWTKIPAIFIGRFGIFRGVLTFIYFTIPLRTLVGKYSASINNRLCSLKARHLCFSDQVKQAERYSFYVHSYFIYLPTYLFNMCLMLLSKWKVPEVVTATYTDLTQSVYTESVRWSTQYRGASHKCTFRHVLCETHFHNLTHRLRFPDAVSWVCAESVVKLLCTIPIMLFVTRDDPTMIRIKELTQ